MIRCIKNQRKPWGYTLIEVMSTMTVVAIFSAGSYVALKSDLSLTSQKSKLPQDVGALNRAVSTYLASGGSLEGVTTPAAVLAKLKSKATNRNIIAAMSGSMVDQRLTAVTSTGSLDEVAIWDADKKAFRIVSKNAVPNGVTPIGEFVVDPSAAITVVTEDRTTPYKLAQTNNWIWDYQNQASEPPSRTLVRPGVTTQTTPQAPAAWQAGPLTGPSFSLPGGTYPLSQFPASITLANPNAPGSSNLWVSLNSTDWSPYSGAITIQPGVTVKAYAEALTKDQYSDSDLIQQTYSAQKVTLEVGDNLKTSYAYPELGGPLASGSVATAPPEPGRLLLMNPDKLPDQWENHNVFQMFWTKDGTDPKIPGGSRGTGNNTFENTYPGDVVDLALADFSASASMSLKYYAESKNTNAVTSSLVNQKIINRASIPLLPPLVTPGAGSLSGTDPVSMTLDVSGGKTPDGARIYYRTDGNDPGSGPEPSAGSAQYQGIFFPAPNIGPVVSIVARVYPPTNYKDWFVTSPAVSRTYFLPYADKNVYAVLGTDTSIYVLDPDAGSSQLVTGNAPFNMRTIALDADKAMLYYTEEAISGWRLGRYDIVNNVHTIMGSLATGRAYNAPKKPDNLTFYNGNLFYIPDGTDDLVVITVNNTAIATVAKIYDLQSNTATFSNVGDIAVDDTGWMFFNDSNKRYYRYNLATLSGFKRIGDTERSNDALAIYQGRLYAADTGAKETRRLSPAVGTTLAKIINSPDRRFMDFAAPTSSKGVSSGSSLWVIEDESDGPHLHQLRNYRSPLVAADLDYGILYALDGTSPKSMGVNGLSYIQNMCITNSGMLYFCRNYKTHTAGKDYYRPIFSLSLSGLAPGDALNATFVGDLTAGLVAIAGAVDPDDIVSGLTISPGGQLYGVLREGLPSGVGGEDYLFRVTQTVSSMAGPNLPVALVGKITSALGSSTNTEDLTFAPNGTLYASDTASDYIYTIDPSTGAVLGQFSSQTGADYRALAVDPLDYRLIAADYGTGAFKNNLVKVDGGDDNDDSLIDVNSLFGMANIQAMAFFQGPFILTPTTPDLYAVDGTETIYGLNFDTGSTVPVTDAPFRLRTLAYDYRNQRLYYTRNNSTTMTLGNYNLKTKVHSTNGSLLTGSYSYNPSELPDNLCYYSGSLWYVPPRTDNLVKITLDSSGNMTAQDKAADMTSNTLPFDLIGDLAVASDGWMYFTAVNYEGQRFCRYKISTLSNFEVISGPTPPTITGSASDFTEKWFDALAFSPPDAGGNRTLYGSFASAPSPLRKVSLTDGSSLLYKPTIPAVPLIDFSDYHPGTSGSSSSAATPILAFSNLNAGYTYADVGGTFLPGLVAAPTPVPYPSLTLVNPNEIPISQQNNTTFSVRWTYDGTNPSTSSTAVLGPNFTNGMPAMPVSVDFSKWGTSASLNLQAVAKSLNTQLLTDSALVTATLPIIKTQLRDPQLTVLTGSNGQRSVQITGAIDAGDCPSGTRIYYTTDGTDPGVTTATNGTEIPVSGSLYTGPITVPTTGTTDFMVTARVYPPSNLGSWFTTSIIDYIEVPLGLAGGHMDVDTSHLLYPFRKGTTDGHVHMYDKKFNVVGDSFFAFKTTTLKNIPVYVANGVKFKIIVANADLSTGGRLVINKTYNSADNTTYIPVTKYDDTAISALPIYSLNGVSGTTTLTQLGLYFDTNAIMSGGLIGTVTGAVRSNTPGLLGEWRNGALTVQLVLVNPDGTDGFKTNTGLSNGGVQGVATSGLLWETTFFWHWQGAAYGK